MDPKTPLTQAGFKFKLYATRLQKLQIETLEDLLLHLPSRYLDRSKITKIKDIETGTDITLTGKISSIKNTFTRKRGFTIQTATLEDDTGKIKCTWFNQPYITRALKDGDTVSITGDIDSIEKIMVKEFEVIKEGEHSVHTGRLVPQYPSTKNVSVKWLRGRIAELLAEDIQIDEPLPEEMLTSLNIQNKNSSLKKIHFPQTIEEAEEARKYFAFEELLLMHLASEKQKQEWKQQNTASQVSIKGKEKELKKLYKSLPFTLTSSQITALEEITRDLNSTTPMNRLLQGDVGSGKTVVAAIAMYITHLNGYKSALMAPTEILTEQHYKTISTLLSPLGVKVALATSNKKIGLKDNEKFDIIVGTHALLNKKIDLTNLGLIVVDEQQRFGVEQRAVLREKSGTPHFLTMTATPIPRTVFLAMYGELSLSYLDTLPTGRKKIKTWVVPEEKRDSAYKWITNHIDEGKKAGINNQVFILCPFIEESESMTSVKAATKEFESLKDGPLKNYKVTLLHGKMKGKEKEEVLTDFRNHKYDVLVTTPVVEVGIDIPDATIMMIEGSDRFGLSQLHQLRGRVGRNDRDSYCLLFTGSNDESKIERLKHLERMHLGADLAEVDLRLRGPGEMYGTKQSGREAFVIARIDDTDLIRQAQHTAIDFSDRLDEFPALRDRLKSTIIQKISRD